MSAQAPGSPAHVLLVSGIAVARVCAARDTSQRGVAAALPLAPFLVAGAARSPVTLTSVFLVFLKIGALVFGSGYVLLAFLRADLVERLHWLTEPQTFVRWRLSVLDSHDLELLPRFNAKQR